LTLNWQTKLKEAKTNKAKSALLFVKHIAYRSAILLTFLFCHSAFGVNEIVPNATCKKAYRAILNLDSQKSKTYLDIEKKTNPDNLLPFILENYIDLSNAAISGSTNDWQNLKLTSDARILMLSAAKENPFKLYFSTELKMHKAIACFYLNENVAAALSVNSAFKDIKRNHRKYPEFQANKKWLGLLAVVGGIIPDEYKVIKWLIGYTGTVKQGVESMTQLLESGNSDVLYDNAHPELLFFLSLINMQITEDENVARNYYRLLATTAYNTALSKLNKILLASFLGKNDDAIAEISILEKYSNSAFPYLEYLKGQCYLRKLDTKAIAIFQSFFEKFQGSHNKLATLQKIAWLELIAGNQEKYKRNMLHIISNKNIASSENDKSAIKEAQGKRQPNVTMLRARLLFDGGYYLKAIAELDAGNSELNLRDRRDSSEYYYRRGRIFQKLNKFKDAEADYNLCLEIGKEFKDYYMANAAFQMGKINASLHQKDKAQAWFTYCQLMDFDEYRIAIKRKAKIALELL